MNRIFARICSVGLVALGLAAGPASAQLCQTSPTMPETLHLGSHIVKSSDFPTGSWAPLTDWLPQSVFIAGDQCQGEVVNSVFVLGKASAQQSFEGRRIYPIPGVVPQYAGNVGYQVYVSKTDGGAKVNPSTTYPGSEVKYKGESTVTMWFYVRLVVKNPDQNASTTLIQSGLNVPAGQVFQQVSYQASNPQPDQVKIFPLQLDIGQVILQVPTCTITADTLTQTIELGEFNVADFTGPGYETPQKTFFLRTQNCNDFTSSLRITFTSQTAVDPAYFPTSTDKLGLHLVAMDAVGAPPGGLDVTPAANQPTFTASTNGSQYEFRASLHQLSAPVQAGAVSSRLTLLVNYQ